jgi:hypothetical protein
VCSLTSPRKTVSTLSDAQRARRAAVITTLRTYRDRGVFPHNYDFPGQAVPYFVDRKTGTLCAVAHLLASTGRRDIVDRVSKADNNVLVPQLAGDTALSAWLSANGLTLEEAAHIQVPYTRPVSNAEVAREVALVIVSPFALAGSAITSISNLRGNSDGHRRWVNAIGIASGLTTVLVGARVAVSDISGDAPSIGGALAAIGTTSTALSVRGIRRHRSIAESQREAAKRAIAQDDDGANRHVGESPDRRRRRVDEILGYGRALLSRVLALADARWGGRFAPVWMLRFAR